MIAISAMFMFMGISGRRYTEKLERRSGCCHLVVLLALFLVQVYLLLGFVFFDRANVDAFVELTSKHTTIDVDPDRFHKLAIESRKRSMQQVWNAFAHTVTDYECSLLGGNSPPKTLSSRLLFDPAAELEFDGGMKALNVTDPMACTPTERNIDCPRHRGFGHNMKAVCSSSTRAFQDDCSHCLESFVGTWEVTQHLEAFTGDAGVMFCRCLTATLEQMQSWGRHVVLGAASVLTLQFLFLISFFWLVLWGAKPEKEAEISDTESSFVSAPSSRGSRETRSWERKPYQANTQKPYQAPYQANMSQMVYNPQHSMGRSVSDLSVTGYLLVEVQCPMESGPGERILVTGPDGRQAEVVVPDDVQPGWYFQCEI